MKILIIILMVLLIGFAYFFWAKGIRGSLFDGKQDPTLILCYTIPTAIIFGILVYKKQFGWSKYDTIVTILVLLCITISFVYKDNPTVSVIVTAIALFFAGIPNIEKLAADEYIPTFNIGILFIAASSIYIIKIVFIKGELIELIFPSSAIFYWFIIIGLEDLIKENNEFEEDCDNQFFK